MTTFHSLSTHAIQRHPRLVLLFTSCLRLAATSQETWSRRVVACRRLNVSKYSVVAAADERVRVLLFIYLPLLVHLVNE